MVVAKLEHLCLGVNTGSDGTVTPCRACEMTGLVHKKSKRAEDRLCMYNTRVKSCSLGEDTMFDLNSSYIQKQWQGTTASRVGTAQVQLREEERDRATLRVG
jgi:hypothetical protein